MRTVKDYCRRLNLYALATVIALSQAQCGLQQIRYKLSHAGFLHLSCDLLLLYDRLEDLLTNLGVKEVVIVHVLLEKLKYLNQYTSTWTVANDFT